MQGAAAWTWPIVGSIGSLKAVAACDGCAKLSFVQGQEPKAQTAAGPAAPCPFH
jgi:hypothetical protein